MLLTLTHPQKMFTREYFNSSPQIFLKFSGLQDSGTGMERYPSPKLAAEIHFYYLKNSVQFGAKKYLFRHNLKPIIIPCRTPKSSA